jgi:5-formyltetrahydrofolate cyclo-ligase
MPLVGFDEQKNRLGMGGGFYDRTLAFKKHQKHTHPKLIGLKQELPVAAMFVNGSKRNEHIL